MSAVGVVLAGGLGRRIGGDKAIVELDGLALLHYPLRALAAVTERQAVVAKSDTALPQLPDDVAVWQEPREPRHPLTGILHALVSARGQPVLCCAVDMPLMDPSVLSMLLDADAGHDCVVPRAGGRVQPLCALWLPRARKALERVPSNASMRDVLAGLDTLEVPFKSARAFTNVNAPEDLLTISRT